MTQDAHADFWEWSLDCYARKGVSSILLRLQDEFHLNVNLMLWCLWCADGYEQVPELVLRKAQDLTRRWNGAVVSELRAVRKSLKSPPPQVDAEKVRAFRERVKKAELEAEEIEQAMLDKLAREVLKPPHQASTEERARDERARRNLASYAALAGAGSISGFSVSLLEQLLEATGHRASAATVDAHE